jgi:hypothetical protein
VAAPAVANINTIRAWLAHISLDTTNIYAEVDYEEVGSRQQREVDSNEDRPRDRSLAPRRGWQAVPSQNIANRLIGNHVPEIGHGARDPVVAQSRFSLAMRMISCSTSRLSRGRPGP